MSTLLATVMLMDAQDGTLVAVGLGFVATILILWGTPMKRTEIFGYALLFSALAYYAVGVIGSLVFDKTRVRLPKDLIAFVVSGFGGCLYPTLGLPWLRLKFPKWLDKKVGLDDDI